MKFNIWITGVPERENREIIRDTIQENFLKQKDVIFQIERAYWAPKTMDENNPALRHITVKLQNPMDKNSLKTFTKQKQDFKKNQVSECLQTSQ